MKKEDLVSFMKEIAVLISSTSLKWTAKNMNSH